MKNFFLIIAFLIIIPIQCFASDIYVGNFSGFTVYLKGDSVKYEVELYPKTVYGASKLSFECAYIPDEKMLTFLKNFYLRDDINYLVESYSVIGIFDRMNSSKPANTLPKRLAGKVYDLNNNIITSENKVKLIKQDNSSFEERSNFIKILAVAVKYAEDHPEVVHKTVVDLTKSDE